MAISHSSLLGSYAKRILGSYATELCDPLLIQHVVCEETCKLAPDDPNCASTCIDVAEIVHKLRETICTMINTQPTGMEGENSSSLSCARCGAARSFIHLQGSILIWFGVHGMYRAWHTANTIREFVCKCGWPVLVLSVGATSISMSWLV
jgi:hypothetical protein